MVKTFTVRKSDLEIRAFDVTVETKVTVDVGGGSEEEIAAAREKAIDEADFSKSKEVETDSGNDAPELKYVPDTGYEVESEDGDTTFYVYSNFYGDLTEQ